MSLQTCSDTTEAVALESSLGLYLKPISRIKINVQLPKLKTPGQSISSWNVMEKIKAAVSPDQFLTLKALKITSNVIKFEGELESKTTCERALARLRTTGSIKLSGFTEKLQLRAAHAPCSGPTRHDWEAFYRDAKGVNEMKPGERPDTIHLQDVPVRWFSNSGKPSSPSEKILRKAFESYGRIRRLEIPSSNNESNTFGKKSSLHNDLLFEAYIQYEEYVEFSIAMDSLRGKKLLFKDADGKVYAANIKVDFDRTNYLSDRCINKRALESKKVNQASSESANKQSGGDEKSKDLKTSVMLNISDNGNSSNSKTSFVSTFGTVSQTVIKEEQKDLLKRKLSGKEGKLLLKELLSRAEKSERLKEKSVIIKASLSQPSQQFNKRKRDLSCEKFPNIKKKDLTTTNEKDCNKNKNFATDIGEFNEKKRSVTKNEKEWEKKKTIATSSDDVYCKMKRDLIEETVRTKKQKSFQTKLKDKSALLNLQLEKKKKDLLLEQERLLKEKLLRNFRLRELQKTTESREKLRKELAGRHALKSVLALKKSCDLF